MILNTDADKAVLSDSIQFSKYLGSKLFALFVVEPNRIARLASLTHQKMEVVHRKTEEEGWKLLYLLEDEAVENGVWTSLHLEEGNLMHLVSHFVESYGIDALLVKRKDECKKIFLSSSVPVFGL